MHGRTLPARTPLAQLVVPGLFLPPHIRQAVVGRLKVRRQRFDALQQQCGKFADVAAAVYIGPFGQAQHVDVGVALDQLGLVRPVGHVVLGQRAEGPQAGPQGNHHVCLFNRPHGRFGTAVADGTAGQGVAGRKGIVMQVGIDDRRRQVFGQGLDRINGIGLGNAPAGNDHRILGLNDHPCGRIQVFQ